MLNIKAKTRNKTTQEYFNHFFTYTPLELNDQDTTLWPLTELGEWCGKQQGRGFKRVAMTIQFNVDFYFVSIKLYIFTLTQKDMS